MSLGSFFYPKSAAVIGASNEKGSVGYTIMQNFLRGKMPKKAYPVNPKHAKIQGKRSYRSVGEIPGKVELAVIVVPAKIVPIVLGECAVKKVKAVIIISAGFSEVGEYGLAKEIEEIVGKNPGMRVMGPNCIGVLVPENGLDSTFFQGDRMCRPKAGNVSFISQSGALGAVLLDWASGQEFGLGKFISYGNAVDVDEADLLGYLAKDKKSKVIAMYMEGAKDGRKFFEYAKKVSKKTPIVMIKGGKAEETRKATMSHTGSLAGSSKVYDAVFEQSGIIQAGGLIELFALAKILENEPLPKGNRVQIITNGGGFGIVTADAVIGNGLKLAKMSAKSKARLKKGVPNTVTVGNPMDLVGDAGTKRYVNAVEAALKDKNVDMVVVVVLFNTPTLGDDIVGAMARLRKTARKPMVVLSIGSEFTRKKIKRMEEGGITTFHYPEIAAVSLKALADYAAFRKQS